MAAFSDEDLELDKPVASVPANGDRKPCPMCGEMIQKDAVKCRFCGEIFDPVLKQQEKRSRKSTNAADEDMTTGDWVVAVLCSGIACIFGIVWMIQGKPKGKKMVLVSLGMNLFWTVVQMIIKSIATHQH